MSELRTMTVPANKVGLTEGTWLRWTELRLFLLDRDERDLVERIEHQMLHEQELWSRAIKVRR